MSIKKSQVARHVRVKLNENFQIKCLGDKYLIKDKVIYIADEHVYNDQIGEYVHIKGYTLPKNNDDPVYLNNGYAYLDQLDLEFPIDELFL